MTPLTDIHTHTAHPTGVLSVEPTAFHPSHGQYYSVGIHPWNTVTVTSAALDALSIAARHPQVVALGETGLDRLRGADLELQEQIFAAHLALAGEINKPVVIHCVRAYDRLFAAVRAVRAGVPIIIHGFRGKPQLAAALLREGYYLSFGERFNPDALRSTPPERLVIETDTSALPIEQIAERVAAALDTDTEQILTLTSENIRRILR